MAEYYYNNGYNEEESNSEDAYNIIGSGSFGYVVRPALNNINLNKKEFISFGNDTVAKLFIEKEDYNAELAAAQKIRKNIPGLYINTTPYKYIYHFADLPRAVQGRIGDHSRNTPIYAFRMPYLGDNLHVIMSKYIADFKKLKRKVLCREILKLLRIVKSIKDAGYIHGDIRDANVLCNTDTGIFTIIDFGFLTPADEFIEYYLDKTTFFYSHPPELIVLSLQLIDKLYKRDIADDKFLDELHRIVHTATVKYADFVHKYNRKVPLKPDVLKTIVLERANELRDVVFSNSNVELKEEYIKTIPIKYLETVDMYGLGTALYGVMFAALGRRKDANFAQFLFEKLFPHMLEPDYTKRGTIEEAIEMMERYIDQQVTTLKLDEVPTVEDELRRLALYLNVTSGKKANTALGEHRDPVLALAAVTNAVEEGAAGGAGARNAERSPAAAGAGAGPKRTGGRRMKLQKTRRRIHKKRRCTQRRRA